MKDVESSRLSSSTQPPTTSSTTSSTATSTVRVSNTPPPGMIGGLVAGGLAAIGLITALVTFLVLRSKKKPRSQNQDMRFQQSPAFSTDNTASFHSGMIYVGWFRITYSGELTSFYMIRTQTIYLIDRSWLLVSQEMTILRNLGTLAFYATSYLTPTYTILIDRSWHLISQEMTVPRIMGIPAFYATFYPIPTYTILIDRSWLLVSREMTIPRIMGIPLGAIMACQISEQHWGSISCIQTIWMLLSFFFGKCPGLMRLCPSCVLCVQGKKWQMKLELRSIVVLVKTFWRSAFNLPWVALGPVNSPIFLSTHALFRMQWPTDNRIYSITWFLLAVWQRNSDPPTTFVSTFAAVLNNWKTFYWAYCYEWLFRKYLIFELQGVNCL